MGLFDGAHRRASGLRLDRARRRGCSTRRWCWSWTPPRRRRSVAALVHGFRTFDRAVRLGGVDPQPGRLATGTRRSCARRCDEVGVPVLGALRRADAVAAPSRHLGLVPAAERRAEALASVRRARRRWSPPASTWTPCCALARSAPPLHAAPWDPAAERRAGARPAAWSRVAGGPAFTFALRRDRRAADRRRRRGGRPSTRCATRRCPPGTARRWSSAAASPRCTPPSCPPTSRCAPTSPRWPRRGGADRRRVRRAALPVPRRWTAHPMCGVLDADAAMTPTADPRLPRRGRARPTRARRRPAPGCAATSSTARTAHPRPGAHARPGSGRRRDPRASSPARVHASYLHLHWAGSPGAGRPVRRRLRGRAPGRPQHAHR